MPGFGHSSVTAFYLENWGVGAARLGGDENTSWPMTQGCGSLSLIAQRGRSLAEEAAQVGFALEPRVWVIPVDRMGFGH
jgi:hypothetical protein